MLLSAEELSILDQSLGVMGKHECLEISHPKWPTVLRYVVESRLPIIVRHEDGQTYEYVYSPIQITRSADEDTLEQSLQFMIGDLGETIPKLIDQFIYDEDIECPRVNYRLYFMGRLENPLFVDKNLELEIVTRDSKGTKGESQAPGLNNNGNGELYSVSTDPSFGGFY